MRISKQNTPSWSSTLTTTSLYDPEEEFQEIGIKYSGKTFWKLYGPRSCDAVSDETGASLVLIYNALDHLTGIVSQQGTLYAESIAGAQKLSQYGGNIKIYGIYNATNSGLVDTLECGLGYIGLHSPTVQLLKNQWNHFIQTHGPDAKFLQISHSGGALQVYNALLTSPKSVQEKIISAAFAPAAIIPEELCFKSYNYVSRRDFVTHLDVIGKLKYGDQLQILEPDTKANFWDHEFLSPTFAPLIKRRINDYIEKYGSKK